MIYINVIPYRYKSYALPLSYESFDWQESPMQLEFQDAQFSASYWKDFEDSEQ